MADTPDTIVLVHGFWVTPRSWEHWIDHYQAQGFRVLAPAYPGYEVEVEALNADPTPIEEVTVPAIIGRLEAVVAELAAPPILIGHSAGGAFVQILLDHGVGAAGVAIRPRTAVPVHYEAWSHFQEERATMEAAFAAAPVEVRTAVRWARLGEPLDVVA